MTQIASAPIVIRISSRPTQISHSHEHQEVDRRQLLCIDGLTAYEVFLECQSEDCSEEASLILAEGDFPDSPEEVDDLMYDVYQWFRKNAATLVPYKMDASLYIATHVLIAGEEDSRSLLRSRIALFLAADEGYQDGDHSRLPKRRGAPTYCETTNTGRNPGSWIGSESSAQSALPRDGE